MNMEFSISNLTIIVMTAIVVFCNASLEEFDLKELSVYDGPEEREGFKERGGFQVCIDTLINGGYSIEKTGFENLQTRVKNLNLEPRNGSIDLEHYKTYAKNEIYEMYIYFYDPSETFHINLGCKRAYFCHLALHVLDPENMLPVQTWCEIHGNGTYDAYAFLRKNGDIYKKYFRRIAKDAGFPRKKQILVYRTMDVCYREITEKSSNTYFYAKYKNIKKTDYKPSHLNWCAINVCYESLTDAGFLDVSAKQNIQNVMLSTFKINETYGYAYEFYQYLVDLRKQPTDDYQIVNPNDSKIGIQVGYLRNWCGVQVCHADLKDEGYLYDNFTDNFIHVLPSIDTKISNGQILSQFVKDFSAYMNSTMSNINNGTPRSPLDWCKFTIVYATQNGVSNETKKKD